MLKQHHGMTSRKPAITVADKALRRFCVNLRGYFENLLCPLEIRFCGIKRKEPRSE